MRKLMISFFLLVLGVAAGFATGSSEAEAAGPETVRFVVPGSDPPYKDEVLAAVNEKLATDGANAVLNVETVAWDVWDSKTNVMLTGGETVDLMHLLRPTSSYYADDVLLALDDFIDEFGPNLTARIPELAWQVETFDGQIYAIPAMWIEMGNVESWIVVRQDLLDQAGLEVPTTAEEMVETAVALQEVFNETYGTDAYIWYNRPNMNPHALFPLTDEFPFYADATGVELVTMDGTVSAYPYSDAFEQMARINREFYLNGVLHPDLLSVPRDQYTTWRANGDFLFWQTRSANLDRIRRQYPEAELTFFQLNPERAAFRKTTHVNKNGIPYTATNPGAAIRFLDWLHADEANHDLLIYGIPGTHFDRVSEHRMDRLVDPGQTLGTGVADWMAGYYDWRKYDLNAPDLLIEIETEPNPSTVDSPTIGFTFDTTPVQAEYVNVVNVISSDFVPILMGVVDYDEGFAGAKSKLDAAGIQNVIAEYQRQYDAWRADQ